MTMPAPISTTFLMMYWPSSVGANGKRVNVSVGNRISGMAVPTICTASRRRVARRKRFVSSPSPIAHSQVASTGSETAGPTMPRVRCSIVRVARSSAGLMPGTNFSAPNHKKMNPSPTLMTVMPCRASDAVIAASSGSNLDGTPGGGRRDFTVFIT